MRTPIFECLEGGPMSADRVIAALLAAAGGRLEIPVGIYEQISHAPDIRTWLSPEGGYVWALDAPGLAEIQAQDEAAYAVWLADQVHQGVATAVAEAIARVCTDSSNAPLDSKQRSGFEWALYLLAKEAGVLPASHGGSRPTAEEVPLPQEPQTPESWTTP